MGFYRLATPNYYNEIAAILTCSWSGCEHQIEWAYFEDDDDRDLIVKFRLSTPGFWQRVWTGIRYIFGYKSRYGDFDEMVLGVRDTKELVAFLSEWLDRWAAVSTG